MFVQLLFSLLELNLYDVQMLVLDHHFLQIDLKTKQENINKREKLRHDEVIRKQFLLNGVSARKMDQIDFFFEKKFLNKIDVDLII